MTCRSKTTNQLQKAFLPIIYWFYFSNTINDFEVHFFPITSNQDLFSIKTT